MGLKVLIADDDALARSLIEAIVNRDDGLELVGAAEDAAGAIELAGRHQPDVAVLDWMMPGGGGPAAARDMLLQSPVTSSDSQEAEMDMLRAGARSILVKGCPPDELARTIHAAVSL